MRSTSAVRSGCVIAPELASVNAFSPRSLYAFVSSRLAWTSATVSFALWAACSAAALALSKNPIRFFYRIAEPATGFTLAPGLGVRAPASDRVRALHRRRSRLDPHLQRRHHPRHDQTGGDHGPDEPWRSSGRRAGLDLGSRRDPAALQRESQASSFHQVLDHAARA